MSIMIGALAACGLVNAQQAAQEPDLAVSPDRLRQDAVQSAAVPLPKTLPPIKLSRDERTLARHIAGTYRVANESIERFVHYAFKAASEFRLDPSLILAVMAVESGFNPDAQSSAGAQGLMQVHTRVHTSKFEPFGGPAAAYDPMANIKVGARILSEYVNRYGTVAAGLKAYVGAALHDSDGGYGSKVLNRQAEFDRAVRARSGGTRQAVADESAGRSSTLSVGAMVDGVGTSIGL
ncbi:MAG: transglycosylase SLT domain-containing protein [Lautropia sp.]